MASAPTTAQANQALDLVAAFQPGPAACASLRRAGSTSTTTVAVGPSERAAPVAAGAPGRRRCRCCRRGAARCPTGPRRAGGRRPSAAARHTPRGGPGPRPRVPGRRRGRPSRAGPARRRSGPGRSRRRAPGRPAPAQQAAPRRVGRAVPAGGLERAAGCRRRRGGRSHAAPRAAAGAAAGDRREPRAVRRAGIAGGHRGEVVDGVDVAMDRAPSMHLEPERRKPPRLVGPVVRRCSSARRAKTAAGSAPGRPMTHQPPSVRRPEHGDRARRPRRRAGRAAGRARCGRPAACPCRSGCPSRQRRRASAQALASRSAKPSPRWAMTSKPGGQPRSRRRRRGRGSCVGAARQRPRRGCRPGRPRRPPPPRPASTAGTAGSSPARLPAPWP